MTFSNKHLLFGWPFLAAAALLIPGVGYKYSSPASAHLANGSAPTATPMVQTQAFRTFTGFVGPINAVAYLPDGSGILAIGQDGIGRLWDINSGVLRQTYTTNNSPLFNVSISPSKTSSIVATGGGDINDPTKGNIFLYDIGTGKLLLTLSTQAAVDDLAFVPPDGHYLIAASEDKMLSVFDVTVGGNPVKVFDSTVLNAVVSAIMVNWAGTQILTGDNNGTVRLWQFDQAALTLTQSQQYDGLQATNQQDQTVNSVAFSPNEKMVLAGNHGGKVILWNLQPATRLHIFEGHSASVNFVDFFPDGTRILTASDDATARIWDIDSAMEVCRIQIDSNIQDASIAPDGQYIVTAAAGVPSMQMWKTCP